MTTARRSYFLASFYVASTLFSSLVLAKGNDTLPAGQTPFTDPKDDSSNPLRYIPEGALTITGVTLYFWATVILLGVFLFSRWKATYMLSVIIGSAAMTVGMALRFVLARHPDSSGVYIAEQLLVVLSPVGFIAGNYILLGRLARHLDSPQHLIVPALKITKIFMASDITTFLIQATGGAMSASKNVSSAKLGSHIFLGGLTLQMISYFFYTGVYAIFIYRVYTRSPEVWRQSKNSKADGSQLQGADYKWWRDWRALAGALAVSCIGIMVRSVYRTIELAQGYLGALATNEHTFYGFDTLPLFIAISIYIPFWPGRFIDSDRLAQTSTSRSDRRRRSETLGSGIPDEGARGEGVELERLPGGRT